MTTNLLPTKHLPFTTQILPRTILLRTILPRTLVQTGTGQGGWQHCPADKCRAAMGRTAVVADSQERLLGTSDSVGIVDADFLRVNSKILTNRLSAGR